MPTLYGKFENNQIVHDAIIGTPREEVDGTLTTSFGKMYKALLDTGAQGTLISSKVINELELVSIGPASLTPATGKPVPSEKYQVRVAIPVVTYSPGGEQIEDLYSRGLDMSVVRLPYQPQNYDVLIGMDFISQFHMTIHLDNYIISI